VEKPLREAKRNTSWVEPNERWERQVKDFCRGLYDNERFRAAFEPFAAEVAAAGERAALAQLALRLTSPGVPDIYNGDELPYFALLDPDNRRPVDWDACRGALAGLDAGPTRETAKLWVIRELLALRRRHAEAFAGPYDA